MTNPNDDFTSRGWLVATATLAVLIVVSFIPPIDAGGVSLRRASIISDLIDHNDHSDEAAEAAPEIDVAEFEVDLEQVASQVAEATASATPTGEATSASWEGIFDEQPTGGDYAPIEEEEPLELDALLTADFSALLPADSTIVSVEEFRGDDFDTPMGRLYEKLLLGQEPVRVAFMGDSFVEGDILTADLRELLQDTFSGGGVGFVPVASPLTGFRQTVKTTSKGWTPYNIMQRRTVPEPYVGDFFVSGWVAKASAGASTRWEMSDKRRHLQECQRARLTFICREAARIAIRLNDGEERLFDFEAGDIVRQIVVEEEQIRSLEMRVESGEAGFTAIGADFDSIGGVQVDNLSIRSNNGQAMFWSSAAVNAQMHAIRPYDLVILQYGLNIMQADRHNYSLYGEQVEKMVRYVESCFPGAAVVVMGVSDRAQRDENGFAPMDEAPDLVRAQREAAERCRVAFWDTYEAMQRKGGMIEFVAQGWAGKDYTHINYAGGREVARALYHALLQGAERHSRTLRQRMEMAKPVIENPLPMIAQPMPELPDSLVNIIPIE
ncbi:MAG: hypothetical protein J6A18_05580 [Alistipes sp.]|nr:hypothetical protein [Alistipes sp.]